MGYKGAEDLNSNVVKYKKVVPEGKYIFKFLTTIQRIYSFVINRWLWILSCTWFGNCVGKFKFCDFFEITCEKFESVLDFEYFCKYYPKSSKQVR